MKTGVNVRSAVAGCLVCTLAGGLSAGEFTVAADYSWEEDAGLEDLAGGNAVGYQEYGLDLEWARGDKAGQLALDAGYSWLEADWQGSGLAGSGAVLFDNAETFSVGGVWSRRLSGAWGGTVFVGLEDSVAGDSVYGGADTGDGLAASLGLGARYDFSRDFALTLGFLMEDNPAGMDDDFLPYVGIYWRISEEWTLQTREGVLLEYSLSPELSVTGSALWDSRELALGKDGTADVVYEEEGIRLGLRVNWRVGEGWIIEPHISYSVAREVTLWRNGRETMESDQEDRLGAGVRAVWSF